MANKDELSCGLDFKAIEALCEKLSKEATVGPSLKTDLEVVAYRLGVFNMGLRLMQELFADPNLLNLKVDSD